MSSDFFKINKGVTLKPQSSTPSNSANGDMYYDSTLGKFRKYENGVWTDFGSGSGGINYISNPDAEADTTGWATYADAAAATPVDGTGGSPNVTITRTTSGPLRGLGSFLITKDAANRQGQGSSYAFTIADADKAKVLAVSFDYEIASGTFATSDLTVYLYDVTNSLLIQPAGYSIQNTLIESKHIATFQTASNSTSYRLIFHVASTSALSYTLKFDNVQVGPQIIQYGSVISDFPVSTLMVGATTTAPTKGTVTVDTVHSTQVGSWMEAVVNYIQTTAGAAAGSGTYLFTLPNGLSVDTSKLHTNTAAATDQNDDAGYIGTGYIQRAGALAGVAQAFMYDSTRFYLKFSAGTSDTTGTTLSTDAGNAFSSTTATNFSHNLEIVLHLRIPIAGWGSSVQVSSSTDTRIVAARFTTATAQSIPDSVFTIIDFNTKDYDTHSAVTTGGSWKYTAQVPGKYQISGTCNTASNTIGTGQWVLGIFKNNTEVSRIGSVGINNGNMSLAGSATIDLIAGDFVDIRLFQSNGVSRSLNAASALNWISIERLSGPSTIAATETVAAKYGGSTSTLTNNTEVSIVFTTKVFDTHNAYNTSTGFFTAPVPGKYRVTSLVAHNTFAASSVTTSMYVYIYKNSVTGQGLKRENAYTTSSVERSALISTTVDLLAGDTITTRHFHNFGTTPTINNSANETFFSIERIGN